MKKVRWAGWVVFSLCVINGGSFAQAAGPVAVTVEPLIGYERVQKIVPTPHSTSRLFYGARATAGLPLIAAEGEVTQSEDTEEFPNDNLTVKDKDLKFKLGLRSTLRFSDFLSFYARAGGQATKNTHTETTSGVAVTTETPIKYRPYAGAGLTAGLSSKIRLSGGVTVVFNDFPDMDKNEYQTSLGFVVKFP